MPSILLYEEAPNKNRRKYVKAGRTGTRSPSVPVLAEKKGKINSGSWLKMERPASEAVHLHRHVSHFSFCSAVFACFRSLNRWDFILASRSRSEIPAVYPFAMVFGHRPFPTFATWALNSMPCGNTHYTVQTTGHGRFVSAGTLVRVQFRCNAGAQSALRASP